MASGTAFGRTFGLGFRAAGQLVVGIDRAAATLPDDAAALRDSFLTVALAVPVVAVTRWLDWRDQNVAPHFHAAGISFFLFVIGWAGFLVASRQVLRMVSLERVWPRMAVLWNWSNLAQYAVLAAVDAADGLHTPAFAMNVLGLVGLFWQTWIEWRALRLATGSTPVAIGLVAMDFAIGVAVQIATFLLHG